MRFSEIAGLQWENVSVGNRTIFLPDTKNGYPRNVPLSSRALSAVNALPRSISGKVFWVKAGSIRTAFLIALDKARASQADKPTLLAGLRFHDLRHEAVTRLFEKGLNPIEVGMVSGHRTISMLQRYTHLRTESLVAKLG
jgi:hypothetical protein